METQPALEDVRTKLALIGLGVAVVLGMLYLANLLYIQSFLVVGGAAVILGTYVYDRGAPRGRGRGEAERLNVKMGSLQEDLASVEQKLAGNPSESERRSLRAKEAKLEQELRKLRWIENEHDIERMQAATGNTPLHPRPRRMGYRERRRKEARERSHLLRSLDEAKEVLKSEFPESARARVALIASDLKAHYGVLKGSEERSKSLGDYAAGWTVLHSVSRGNNVGTEVFRHVPRKVRSRLKAILDLAGSRGVFMLSVPGA